jgi:hypothetical protein
LVGFLVNNKTPPPGFFVTADSMGLIGEMKGKGGEVLNADFNTEGTEYTKKGKRDSCRTGDDHGEW